ncbi:AbrB/MazE/SpoVT family DNA-binding domain-containing protein [Anaerofilum hominis]|uniref:AbrB/MazE/SpoVT family DNA-binding domain-containing protein n=1 Tax=Anaerofilum hominis TaxID=2763016 RepID=UPI003C302519
MKSTGILRKVDGLGRVALPLETRKSLDIGEEDSLELLVDEENGRIIFEKVSKKCLRCGSADSLKEIKPGFFLCENCIRELK